MTLAENFVGEPSIDCVVQLIKFAGEKMIGVFDNNEMILACERGNERFDFFDGPVLVVASMHKQLGLIALAQEGEIRAVDRDAQADQASNA